MRTDDLVEARSRSMAIRDRHRIVIKELESMQLNRPASTAGSRVRPGRRAETVVHRGRPGSRVGAARGRSCAEAGRTRRAPPTGLRSLLFTSGKGGVGTSNLVLNLAIALGEMGQRVLVVDADIGLANLDLLCGLAPRYDLGDVLAGRCGLAEAVMPGPGGIRIVPGRTRSGPASSDLGDAAERLVRRAGRAGVGVRLRAGGRGLGPGPGATDAGGGGRSGGDRQHARADLAGRCPRGDRPVSRSCTTRPRCGCVVNQARSAAEACEVLDRLVASSRQFLGRGGLAAGAGVCAGRSPRADGGPHPSAVRDRVSGVGRLARRPAACPALVRSAHPPDRSRRAGLRQRSPRLRLSDHRGDEVDDRRPIRGRCDVPELSEGALIATRYAAEAVSDCGQIARLNRRGGRSGRFFGLL